MSDVAARKAQTTGKLYRLHDEKGLYLLVKATGTKGWGFDYALHGRRNTMSLGVYPDVSLRAARQKRDEARDLLREGVDPVRASRQLQAEQERAEGDTFSALADDYIRSLEDMGRAERLNRPGFAGGCQND